MDTDTYSCDEDISPPSAGEPVFTSSGGGMFADSQYFTVAGGTFNNIMNLNYHAAQTVPPDFRMISMGDIDLQQELMVNEVVRRRRARNCVRRVYSATVDGRNSNVTVAVYQGDGAEEDWRRDTETYMSVRHPNIMQTWAGASYKNIHAIVFHGDLVPLRTFLARQSPIMTVYLYACCAEEWRQVEDYFQSLGMTLDQSECTMWIRTSTSRLSVDLVPSNFGVYLLRLTLSNAPSLTSVEHLLQQTAWPSAPPDWEVVAIESLALMQYYRICALYLRQYRGNSIPTSATVNIGAVIFWPSPHQYEGHAEIASLRKLDDLDSWWFQSHREDHPAGNGWSRYRADDVFNIEINIVDYDLHETWLSQANYIFSRLQIKSNLEDYFLINHIVFTITIEGAGEDPPPGYLFLCPKEDFQTGPTSVRWPKCPAYWSLDPEGIEVLSTEEAGCLGFPPMHLTTRVEGRSWDDSVYAGLRKFHQAKGFDPDSQDIARHLGYRFYKLPRDVDPPFSYEEISADDALNSNGGPGGDHSLNGQIAPPEAPGIPALEESQIVSRGFHFTMVVKLALILFLSLSSLYEQVF